MGTLSEYIYEQQRAGYSNEGIRTQLRQYGWSEEAMAEGFNEAEEWHEERKYTGYSVGSILLIVLSTLAIVGASQYTGYVTGGEIQCLLENPAYPGYFDLVHNIEDCKKIAINTICEPVKERIALEADGKVIFEAHQKCKGPRANIYTEIL